MSKLPTVKATVWSVDRNTEMKNLEIINSYGKGYYVRISKYGGLSKALKQPKSGFTTVWLQGSLRDGLILPKGSLTV